TPPDHRFPYATRFRSQHHRLEAIEAGIGLPEAIEERCLLLIASETLMARIELEDDPRHGLIAEDAGAIFLGRDLDGDCLGDIFDWRVSDETIPRRAADVQNLVGVVFPMLTALDRHPVGDLERFRILLDLHGIRSQRQELTDWS